MARIRRTKPCPTPEPPKDPEDRKELAESFGLKGAEKAKFQLWAQDNEVSWLAATLMSFDYAARNHPVMRDVARRLMKQADHAKRLNKHFGGYWDKMTGYDRASGKVRGMSETEQAEYMRAMLATEQKDWLTDDELRDMKLSKKAMDVYRFHRRVMPRALEVYNFVRKVKGLEPIEGIEGVYFPHEFDGNFHLQNTESGKGVYVEGGSAWDTQADAWEALRKHFGQHPEDIGKVEIIADYKKKLSFAIQGDPSEWGRLNEVLGDVARGSHVSADKAAEWFRDGRKKTGAATHMIPRMGSPGYDTKNVFKVMSEYLNAMPWWATAEIAREDLHKLILTVDPMKEPHTTAAFTRFVAQTYGLPGATEIGIDQFINGLTKTKVGKAIAEVLTPLEAKPLVGPVAKAINPARFNPTRPTRRVTMKARALTSDLKLGFISRGVMIAHMLHSPTNVLPAYGVKYWAKGLKSAFIHDLPKSVHDWGAYQDVFKAKLMDDAPDGPFTKTIARIARQLGANETVENILMSVWRPISASEALLRQSAFYGAYHALKDRGEAGHRLLRLATDDAIKEFPQLDKYTEKFLLEHAKRVVEQVAFRYDRGSRPWWTTTAPFGLLGGQFKTYVTGTAALQLRMAELGYPGRALAPFGVMLLLGGIAGGAIPLVHQMDDAYRHVTGVSPLDEAYLLLRDAFGGELAETFYRGIPALQGIDLGRRVGYSHLHLEGPGDLMGAFAGTIMDAVTAFHYWDLEHALQIAPGLGNFYEAYEWARDGGAMDPYHRGRLRFATTQWDIFKRAMGLEPLIQAQTTDAERISQRRAQKHKLDKAQYIDRMVDAANREDWDTYTKLEAEAGSKDITIRPGDVKKEREKKRQSALDRQTKTLPKSERPWYLREFGPELQQEHEREDAVAAQRALENAQAQPPGTVAIPGELPR